jgi:hypothetical protein
MFLPVPCPVLAPLRAGAHEVLASVAGPITRASALAAFQRRQDIDLGGYRVSYAAGQRRSAGIETQFMLAVDSHVIG